ncbi:unnamed protein product [Sphagnum jensenii]|uniref:Uncharacterized protein n=2 Tax=Sphagnum jensenii TaxID=128206 RepID=A0ABP0X3X5_9BRYO
MSCVMPSTNGPNDYIKKIVKKEGGNSLSFNAKGFTTPLYTEVPKLFSSDGPHSFTKKDFASKYDLCYLGMSPMQIRLLKVCTKEEIEKCFGLIVNKNGHQYINCLDPKLITKVERLWMIVHQKPYILASRIIILGMARGILCEQKGKQLN